MYHCVKALPSLLHPSPKPAPSPGVPGTAAVFFFILVPSLPHHLEFLVQLQSSSSSLSQACPITWGSWYSCSLLLHPCPKPAPSPGVPGTAAIFFFILVPSLSHHLGFLVQLQSSSSSLSHACPITWASWYSCSLLLHPCPKPAPSPGLPGTAAVFFFILVTSLPHHLGFLVQLQSSSSSLSHACPITWWFLVQLQSSSSSLSQACPITWASWYSCSLLLHPCHKPAPSPGVPGTAAVFFFILVPRLPHHLGFLVQLQSSSSSLSQACPITWASWYSCSLLLHPCPKPAPSPGLPGTAVVFFFILVPSLSHHLGFLVQLQSSSSSLSQACPITWSSWYSCSLLLHPCPKPVPSPGVPGTAAVFFLILVPSLSHHLGFLVQLHSSSSSLSQACPITWSSWYSCSLLLHPCPKPAPSPGLPGTAAVFFFILVPSLPHHLEFLVQLQSSSSSLSQACPITWGSWYSCSLLLHPCPKPAPSPGLPGTAAVFFFILVTSLPHHLEFLVQLQSSSSSLSQAFPITWSSWYSCSLLLHPCPKPAPSLGVPGTAAVFFFILVPSLPHHLGFLVQLQSSSSSLSQACPITWGSWYSCSLLLHPCPKPSPSLGVPGTAAVFFFILVPSLPHHLGFLVQLQSSSSSLSHACPITWGSWYSCSLLLHPCPKPSPSLGVPGTAAVFFFILVPSLPHHLEFLVQLQSSSSSLSQACPITWASWYSCSLLLHPCHKPAPSPGVPGTAAVFFFILVPSLPHHLGFLVQLQSSSSSLSQACPITWGSWYSCSLLLHPCPTPAPSPGVPGTAAVFFFVLVPSLPHHLGFLVQLPSSSSSLSQACPITWGSWYSCSLLLHPHVFITSASVSPAIIVFLIKVETPYTHPSITCVACAGISTPKTPYTHPSITCVACTGISIPKTPYTHPSIPRAACTGISTPKTPYTHPSITCVACAGISTPKTPYTHPSITCVACAGISTPKTPYTHPSITCVASAGISTPKTPYTHPSITCVACAGISTPKTPYTHPSITCVACTGISTPKTPYTHPSITCVACAGISTPKTPYTQPSITCVACAGISTHKTPYTHPSITCVACAGISTPKTPYTHPSITCVACAGISTPKTPYTHPSITCVACTGISTPKTPYTHPSITCVACAGISTPKTPYTQPSITCVACAGISTPKTPYTHPSITCVACAGISTPKTP